MDNHIDWLPVLDGLFSNGNGRIDFSISGLFVHRWPCVILFGELIEKLYIELPQMPTHAHLPLGRQHL